MLLDHLRDFEWYNEPQDFSFEEKGLWVCSSPLTDFWQSAHHHFKKDNGHFFFSRYARDFVLTVKWEFDKATKFEQCGIMVRVDEKNWFKASVMYDNPLNPQLGSCVTNNGYSDWAAFKIPNGLQEVWYKVKRYKGDYLIYYSLDGVTFEQIRILHLLNDMPEVKAGAYICSPQQQSFEALLSKIDIEQS